MAKAPPRGGALYAALREGAAAGPGGVPPGRSRCASRNLSVSRADSSTAATIRALNIAASAPVTARGGGHSGQLLKQGAGNKAWQRRWFVLSGDQLMWYLDERATVPKRSVRVTWVSSRIEGVSFEGFELEVLGVTTSAASPLDSMFRRSSSRRAVDAQNGVEGDVYRLAAPTRAAALEWLSALHRALGNSWTPPPEPGSNPLPHSAADARKPPRPDLAGSVASPAASDRPLPPPSSVVKGEEEEASEEAGGDGDGSPSTTKQEAQVVKATAAATKAAAELSVAASPPPAVQPAPSGGDRVATTRADVADGVGRGAGQGEGGGHAKQGRDSARGGGAGAREASSVAGAAEAQAATPEAAEAAVAAASGELSDGEQVAYDTLVLLCQQSRLTDELDDALHTLISDFARLFVRPGDRGIMPVHWLCGAADVTSDLLHSLLQELPAAAACADGRGSYPLHWLAANDTASAEMVLLVLEAFEAAASAEDAFRQLPLHWLCGSAAGDERAVALLLDATAT